MLFLTGCTTTKPDTSRTSSVFVSCSGKRDCPLPEEREKAILAERRKSDLPEAQALADEIESGTVKVFELNERVGKLHGLSEKQAREALGLQVGNTIYLNPRYSDWQLSVNAMREYGHVLTERSGIHLINAPTGLIHERNAFTLQSRFWEEINHYGLKVHSLED